MYKTKWVETQHLFWTCQGCFKRCQVYRVKLDDDLDCDSSEEGVHNAIVVNNQQLQKRRIE